MRKYFAEFLGTLVLVTFGCGIAVVSGGNLVATALAFGLAIVAMAYVIGNISGCHVNPAVSLAMLITKRMSFKDFIFYVIAQFLGAIAGAGALSLVLDSSKNLGANGFDSASALGSAICTPVVALVVEAILTFVFILVILCVTADKENKHAGLVIGLTLTLVHLIGINLTGTSVNPARSLAPAILLMGTAIKQVWVFIVGPIVGALVAGYLYKYLKAKSK